MEVLAGFGIRGLAHAGGGARTEILEYLLTGWAWIIDWTWFNGP